MSKKTSPQARRGSRGRTGPSVRGARGRVAARPERPSGEPAAENAGVMESTALGRVKKYLPVVLVPDGIAVLVIILLSLAGLMFTSTSMVVLPATIAQAWLVANAAPVAGDGVVVGLVPFLPAMLLAWVVSRRVYAAVRDRVSIADLVVLSACVIGVPVLLSATALAMLWDASGVLAVEVPPIASVIGHTALLHVCALVFGMGPRLWRALLRRYRAPEWLVDATGLALRFLGLFALVALVVVLVMMAVNHRNVMDIFAAYPGDVATVTGLILLSSVYLPNAVVAAMGVLMGAPLHIGDGAVSVFSVQLVPLPPVPVMAAVPATAADWTFIFLAIPLLVALALCLRRTPSVQVAVGGAVLAGLFFLILVILTGGDLGVYSYVGADRLFAPLLAIMWLGVPALLVVAVAWFRSRGARSEVEEELVDDREDEHGEEFEEDAEEDSTEVESEDDTEPHDAPIYNSEESDSGDSSEEGDTESNAAGTEPDTEADVADESVEEAAPEEHDDVEGPEEEPDESGEEDGEEDTDDEDPQPDR